MLKLRLSRASENDLRQILSWSLDRFGAAAATRYERLIVRAIADLCIDPERIGVDRRTEYLVPGAGLYSIAFRRKSGDPNEVRDPCHLLLFRAEQDVLLVGRILHDANDLPRHIPKSFRRKLA